MVTHGARIHDPTNGQSLAPKMPENVFFLERGMKKYDYALRFRWFFSVVYLPGYFTRSLSKSLLFGTESMIFLSFEVGYVASLEGIEDKTTLPVCFRFIFSSFNWKGFAF